MTAAADTPPLPERAGASFTQDDVVLNYAFRPPYPPALFDRLVDIAPSRTSLLDIGCGPGKISRPLAPHFEQVTALDPSLAMLAQGRALPGGDAPNIDWINGLAETFATKDRTFDLTVAAASIHWMDHQRLFPRLAAQANPGHVMAVVSGDDAFEPPWRSDWLDFLARWVPAITGEAFGAPAKAEQWARYKAYLDIRGEEHVVSDPFEQSVAEFIACQHSRDTFAPSKLGDRLSAFDRALEEILWPHAIDGVLRYRVRTSMVWGTIRTD